MVARASLTRRGLVGLAALGVLAACGGADDRPRAALDPDDRVRYAKDHPDQFGVLSFPEDRDPIGLVTLIHGGFWSDSYGLDLMEPLAADLRARGYATWNIEYRRLGSGGGYPATFIDVAKAIDFLPTVAEVDGLSVTVIGHSAGGQLAVWAASRTARTPGGPPSFGADLTISLSGVLDLATAGGLGNGAVVEVVGDAPLDLVDPVLLAPAAGRVVAVHALEDTLVPISQSRGYVRSARAAGGDADLFSVPGDHFALIDPASEAWAAVVRLLAQ